MSEWTVGVLRVLAGVAAIALFLVLPSGFAWQALGGLIHGLLIQFSMPDAEDMFWVTHSGASRRERLLTNGALVFAAWLGAWVLWPAVDFFFGVGRPPSVPFVAASFLGAALYFHGMIQTLPEEE